MRKELYFHIKNNEKLRDYLRMHPYWYRKLGRDPESWNEFKYEAKQYYGQTIPQRIEKINHQLQLAMMLLQMFQPR